MATVADYVVVTDKPFDLKSSGPTEKFLNFELPNTIVSGKRGPGILWYMVNSTGKMSGLKAEVRINGKTVSGYGPSDVDLSRPFHEVLSIPPEEEGNVLIPGTNSIEFLVVSGQGTFRVSDVVVFFQNQV
jgi:hypothetical protein